MPVPSALHPLFERTPKAKRKFIADKDWPAIRTLATEAARLAAPVRG